MAFGLNELIIPALVIIAIFIFYKIFTKKSGSIAKQMGKDVVELRKIPEAFKEGIKEAEVKEKKNNKSVYT